jgi:hypothetical protein
MGKEFIYGTIFLTKKKSIVQGLKNIYNFVLNFFYETPSFYFSVNIFSANNIFCPD